MEKLYLFVINKHYKDLLKKGYLSEQDTLYLECGTCYCKNECFYNIKLNNSKIKFATPEINETNQSGVVYSLFPPEIEKQFLKIYVGCFSVYISKNDRLIEDGVLLFERSGTTEYIFQYDTEKLKYVFKSKKEY